MAKPKKNQLSTTRIEYTELSGSTDAVTITTIVNPGVPPVTVSQRTSSECAMRGLLRYGLLLRPKHEGGRRLLGSFIHDGIDAIHAEAKEQIDNGAYQENLEFMLGELVFAANTAIDGVRATRLAEARKSGLFDPSGNAPTTIEVEESANRAKEICTRYVAQWYTTAHDLDEEQTASAHDLITVASEITLTIRLHDEHGRPTRYTHTGKLDRVMVNRLGQFAISDTKSSVTPLGQWKASHDYMPQLWSYAVMWYRATGIVPKYFVDDMISTNDRPLLAHELPRNLDGALSKSAGLPRCLAVEWQRAIDMLAGERDAMIAEVEALVSGTVIDTATAKEVEAKRKRADALAPKEWYFDTLRALKHAEREGRWFMRVIRPMPLGELARAEAEMLADAKAAAKQRRSIAKARGYSITPASTPEEVAAVVNAIPIAERMRATSLCHTFNRPCDYLDFCRNPCASTAALYRVSDTAHAELAEKQTAESEDAE